MMRERVARSVTSSQSAELAADLLLYFIQQFGPGNYIKMEFTYTSRLGMKLFVDEIFNSKRWRSHL